MVVASSETERKIDFTSLAEQEGLFRLKCHCCGNIVAINLPNPEHNAYDIAQKKKAHMEKCAATPEHFSVSIQRGTQI